MDMPTVVEAVGIEPTSESLQQQALHAYPASLLSRPGIRNRPRDPNAIPQKGLDGTLEKPATANESTNVTLQPAPWTEPVERLRYYAAKAN